MTEHESSAFFMLDERIQRFIWAEGWESLRDAQEAAIPLVLPGTQDVIVAAATAAGKTEAAFLPALTHALTAAEPVLITYVSPLKALINDQFGRLDRLCELLDIPVWPWHGDISAGVKTKFLNQRHGVLLITPESLEAFLCNRGSSAAQVFGRLSFFVIDELHAFIGSERGKQLQSLLHRIEAAVGRKVPRVGLSATLGDMSLAAEFLRPGQGKGVRVVESKSSGSELKILVKGYEEPLVVHSDEAENPDAEVHQPTAPGHVAAHMYKALRGSNNLVFPNSRREVERYTHLLNKYCAAEQVPNEFWPHHGNLSKEIRYETEAALKQKERPATAICTNTLELGIDIGAVKSVVQIGTPPSVASLRQRLGRSGRRKGEAAILRAYCIEDALGEGSSLATELRLGVVQTTAMILLLLEKWCEPPAARGAHFSTLVQQLLSAIAQRGGATIGELFSLLCSPSSPFNGVTKGQFVELVRHLGQREFLTQESSGLLLHGRLGEKFVNHYTFYAAFGADKEFRVIAGGSLLGTLPVDQMLQVGQHVLFAGKTWRVEEIDEEGKAIHVKFSPGGNPPLFKGGPGRTHTRVRQKMRQVLEGSDIPPFLDETARKLLQEGRRSYRDRELSKKTIIDCGPSFCLATWQGDSTNETIACLFERRGIIAVPSGPMIEIQKSECSIEDAENVLHDAAVEEMAPPGVLLERAQNLEREKWDGVLPPSLLRESYARSHLDLENAKRWIDAFAHAGP